MIEIKVKDWFNQKIDLWEAEISFNNYTNSSGVVVTEINIENYSDLGLILVYHDGYVHTEIHDKNTTEPKFIESNSFNATDELISILEKAFSKHWALPSQGL